MGCLTILWVCVLMVNDIHTQDVNSLYGLYTQFIYSCQSLCLSCVLLLTFIMTQWLQLNLTHFSVIFIIFSILKEKSIMYIS